METFIKVCVWGLGRWVPDGPENSISLVKQEIDSSMNIKRSWTPQRHTLLWEREACSHSRCNVCGESSETQQRRGTVSPGEAARFAGIVAGASVALSVQKG